MFSESVPVAERVAACRRRRTPLRRRASPTKRLPEVPRNSAPCKAHEAGCADKFGRRAVRRSLTDLEIARYHKLSTADRTKMVIETQLQSPGFLLRTENG